MNLSPDKPTPRPSTTDGPIRVALSGAGAAARMILRHLLRGPNSIRLAAVIDRQPARSAEWLRQRGDKFSSDVESAQDFERAVADGVVAITREAGLACASPQIDVLVEATGTVEYGAQVVMKAIQGCKHVVLANAELDSTLGPVLKAYAHEKSVVISHTDGEEPAVAMSLIRYLRGIGLTPVAAGNIKGMLDYYRTPDTQREFATAHRMNSKKVASFADGTKLSMESCILANATGFRVSRRGMIGPRCNHVNQIAPLLPLADLGGSGLVDFALGAQPGSGAFVVVRENDADKCGDLAYFKMGPGPYYVFYTPFHLPGIQIAATITDIVTRGRATVEPLYGPACEVATVAKRDLKAGEVLDGVGGFMTYGLIENADTFEHENLLSMGVSENCIVNRNIPRDEAIRVTDVEIPAGRLCDELRAKQDIQFPRAGRSPDPGLQSETNRAKQIL
jgi:predicted homoserine dehydrogenase-like protein